MCCSVLETSEAELDNNRSTCQSAEFLDELLRLIPAVAPEYQAERCCLRLDLVAHWLLLPHIAGCFTLARSSVVIYCACAFQMCCVKSNSIDL